VPAAGSRAQREASAKSLFDDSLDELETQTGRIPRTVAAVVDAETVLISRVQAHGDRRGTVLERIRDQLVGDDPELLSRSRVQGCVFGLDCDRDWRPVRDAVEQGACVDEVVGLCQQPVNGRYRVDAGGGVVKSTTVAALWTAK